MSNADRWKLPPAALPLEVVSVPKLINLEQAEVYQQARVANIDPGYPICAGCGGPVLSESSFGVDYCGVCT
jgi:hypothetical protein